MLSDSYPYHSSEGNELGTTGSTVTDLTVANGLVGHGVLTEILANHLSLNINGSPVLAGVDFADGTDHLGHDNSIAQVSLDGLGLFTPDAVFDRQTELLDEAVVLGVNLLEVGVQTPSLGRLEKIDDLVLVHLEKFLEFDTSVDLLLKGLPLGSCCGIGVRHVSTDCGGLDIK